MKWACACAEHVLPLFGTEVDVRLENAIGIARDWMRGVASVSEARDASFGAIAAANEVSDSTSIAVARSIGHAVATAHMSDHSIGASLYALKAVKTSGNSVDTERKWQNEQLPSEIKKLVLTARSEREEHFRI